MPGSLSDIYAALNAITQALTNMATAQQNFFTKQLALTASSTGTGGGGGGGGPTVSTITINLDSTTVPSTRLSFSRASAATYFDSSGLIQSAANDVPRFDHDPVTHDSLGLAVEGPATNLLVNSLLNGTNLSTQSIALTSQNYTLSFYGSGSIVMSGAFSGTLYGSLIANERCSMTFQPTAGTVTFTVSGTVKWAQLETGVTSGILATSFIPTAGAAASRAGDIVAFQSDALSYLQNQSGGTVVVSLRRNGPDYSEAHIIGPDNTLNAVLFSDYGNANNQTGAALFGQNHFVNAGIALSVNRPEQIAGMSWSGSNFSVCVDGFTVGTGTANQIPAVAANRYLGSSALGIFGSQFHGWFSQIVLTNSRVSDSALQIATALPAPTGIGNAIPHGAGILGYNTNVININPAVSDIATSNNAAGFALSDVIYYSNAAPNPSNFTMTNGVLTIPLGNLIMTQKHNSTQGTLPYLSGATGFYFEWDVALSDNNSDHWPAVWSLPWQHDLAQDDHYVGDPAGYERWMELDVDEGGFGLDTLSTVIDWQGHFDSGNGQYWRDFPADTIPGNIDTNFQPLGYLDRTQKHTFGASYSPNEGATGVVRWYLDNRIIFKASAPVIAKQQNFYMIANAQTHGTNAGYNMFLSRMRAYTP